MSDPGKRPRAHSFTRSPGFSKCTEASEPVNTWAPRLRSQGSRKLTLPDGPYFNHRSMTFVHDLFPLFSYVMMPWNHTESSQRVWETGMIAPILLWRDREADAQAHPAVSCSANQDFAGRFFIIPLLTLFSQSRMNPCALTSIEYIYGDWGVRVWSPTCLTSSLSQQCPPQSLSGTPSTLRNTVWKPLV